MMGLYENVPTRFHTPFLVYVGTKSGYLCDYKDGLVPEKVLEAFPGQENCLEFYIIDVEFAFWNEPQTTGCEVS